MKQERGKKGNGNEVTVTLTHSILKDPQAMQVECHTFWMHKFSVFEYMILAGFQESQGQRDNDMIESKLKAKNISTVDNCFDLVGSRQHREAAKNRTGLVYRNGMVMPSDETQIQMFADRSFSSSSFKFKFIKSSKKYLTMNTSCK